MKSFSDVSKTQRETAAVIAISLTFVTLLVASRMIPNIIAKKAYLHPLFYLGVGVFGIIGFLGDGTKVGQVASWRFS